MSNEDTADNAGESSTDESSTDRQQEAGKSGSSDTGDQTDWKAEAAKAAADAEKWRALARKHESRAKDNADAASKAKTIEERLAAAEKALTDRDVADVERNARLALAQVRTQVANSGFKPDEVAGLFGALDPMRLLTDGEPDAKAIDQLAKDITRAAGRATFDRDQGRKGGDGPVDMNTLIRRAAGVQI